MQSVGFRSLKAFDNENRIDFTQNRIDRMHSSKWRDHQLSTIFAPNAFKVLERELNASLALKDVTFLKFYFRSGKKVLWRKRNYTT